MPAPQAWERVLLPLPHACSPSLGASALTTAPCWLPKLGSECSYHCPTPTPQAWGRVFSPLPHAGSPSLGASVLPTAPCLLPKLGGECSHHCPMPACSPSLGASALTTAPCPLPKLGGECSHHCPMPAPQAWGRVFSPLPHACSPSLGAKWEVMRKQTRGLRRNHFFIWKVS